MRHAWSIRLIVVAGVLSGFEALLPFIPVDALPSKWLALTNFIVICSAFVSRLVAQEKIDK